LVLAETLLRHALARLGWRRWDRVGSLILDKAGKVPRGIGH
jgi:hypothetical protein